MPATVVGQVFSDVVGAAVDQVSRVVQPEAVVAVAAEFTFPISLAVAVLAFLMAHGHVDRRDPKLRNAPRDGVETLVQFQGEDQL